MSKKIKDAMFVCEDCGSANIQTKMWVNPNTDKVEDSVSGESDDNWCKDCQTHPNLITYKEYKERKEEIDE